MNKDTPVRELLTYFHRFSTGWGRFLADFYRLVIYTKKWYSIIIKTINPPDYLFSGANAAFAVF